MAIAIKKQNEKREKKTKKIIFNSKREFGKEYFIYDVRNKV